MFYDVVIIGSGPAGLTAALYAERSGLKVIVLEKFMVGGQVATTYEVENYPGFINISGPDLMNKMEEQIKNLNVPIIMEEVTKIEVEAEIKKVITVKCEYECSAIILATGANPKLLGCIGENEFRGKGVSYCATCDGGFFRKKDVIVVGGGNTAVEDAIFLARLCNKVYIAHRRDQFRANKNLIDNMIKIDNIEILYDTVVDEVYGGNIVSGVVTRNLKTDEIKKIELHGMFIAVGIKPNNELVEGMLEMDELGFVITKANMSTDKKGLFVAGDGRVTPLKQIVIAASDGAIAAYSASLYISEI
jgi:thioredoxin reductase (NADPH)